MNYKERKLEEELHKEDVEFLNHLVDDFELEQEPLSKKECKEIEKIVQEDIKKKAAEEYEKLCKMFGGEEVVEREYYSSKAMARKHRLRDEYGEDI